MVILISLINIISLYNVYNFLHGTWLINPSYFYGSVIKSLLASLIPTDVA